MPNSRRAEKRRGPMVDQIVHVECYSGYKADERPVRLHLGAIHPEDVEVQLVHGLVDAMGEIVQPQTVTLKLASGPDPASNGQGTCVYTGKILCRTSGHYGYCVRVLPRNASLPHPFEPGLVTWG